MDHRRIGLGRSGSSTSLMTTSIRSGGDRSLRPRSILIGSRRTSIRLEDAMWTALNDIARRRHMTVDDVLFVIHRGHNATNLSSAIRVYIVDYYRAALARRF